MTDTSRRPPVPVAVADALHKAVLLVGQRSDPVALYLLQQFVQAALLGLALLLLALLPFLGAALHPAPPPALLGPGRRRRRLLAPLQARISLREVVAEKGILAAALQQQPLLLARDVDKQRQAEHQQAGADDGV